LSFEILSSGERVADSGPGYDGAMPSISKVDLAALQAREEQTIREMKKKDAQKGKGCYFTDVSGSNSFILAHEMY
jgi:hypothetical protein